MANLMDYLRWRGDLPFSASPLGEVDNLIFSKMTFIDLQHVLPPYGSGGTMTIGEAARQYAVRVGAQQPNLGLLVPKEIHDMFLLMGQCNRFRHLLLSDYINQVQTDEQVQFAAVTVFLSTEDMYIAFRGTDDTIVGWKENFNMSHVAAVPAQLRAVEYVNAVMARCPHRRVYIGGHSKGGNLAIYSAVHCKEEYKDRIVQVFNNDGPGFRHEMVESAAFLQMQDRITTLIPQSSVVGRLLEHNDRYRVVKSNATGLWQHNGFTWEVLGDRFVPEEELTKESRRIEQSIKAWIYSMSDESREAFVDALYRFLTANNAATLTELTADRTWLLKLMKESDAETRKTLFGGLAQLTGEAGKLWMETVLPFLRGKITSPTTTGTGSGVKDKDNKGE
ncbi:MAG: DUF2974 domain-containing protein [Clostridia bacterium]|nr:DUF2974 domain-containing protein [Clostridia bacterium]